MGKAIKHQHLIPHVLGNLGGAMINVAHKKYRHRMLNGEAITLQVDKEKVCISLVIRTNITNLIFICRFTKYGFANYK